jgi:hypothetical protein
VVERWSLGKRARAQRYWQPTTIDGENGEIIIFGGRMAGAQIDDTWSYSARDNRWTQIQTQDSPEARFQSAFCLDPSERKVILFGGYTFSDIKYFNDTWILDLEREPLNWEEAVLDPTTSEENNAIPGFPLPVVIYALLLCTLYLKNLKRI